jgi:hypothetical protein
MTKVQGNTRSSKYQDHRRTGFAGLLVAPSQGEASKTLRGGR